MRGAWGGVWTLSLPGGNVLGSNPDDLSVETCGPL